MQFVEKGKVGGMGKEEKGMCCERPELQAKTPPSALGGGFD